MAVTSYTRKGIVGVRMEPGNQVAQIGAPAPLSGVSIAATDSSGTSSRTALPLFNSGDPYAAIQLVALTTDIYYALGDSTITVSTTNNEFDSVVPVGTFVSISTRDATHIAAIAASGTSGTLVVNAWT